MSKQSYIVEVKAVIIKQVICEGCTEAQAWTHPFAHSISETETGQSDWEVISVTPND